MSELDDLKDVQMELQRLRVQLPELLQRLASMEDQQNGRKVFYEVAKEVGEWKAGAELFLTHFEQVETMADRIGTDAGASDIEVVKAMDSGPSEQPVPIPGYTQDEKYKYDYGLTDLDGFGDNFLDLT